MKMKNNKEIPIFFAVDDNYAPFLAVALQSIKDNSSKNYNYSVFILNAGLSEDIKRKLAAMNDKNYSVSFVNVQSELMKIDNKLHTRDYYTKSTYYRLFIQKLFPQYDKAIYLDSDIVVTEDISKLYNIELGTNLVAGAIEDVMTNVDIFGRYVEQCLGISRYKFFNAGVLLINLKLFRDENVEGQFVELLTKYKFSVTQDEDYLNVICKDRVHYLDDGWNRSPMENLNFDDKNIKIVHYKINMKPWHYDNIKYENLFWEYAKETSFYNDIKKIKETYSQEQIKRDTISYQNLEKLAQTEIDREDTYFKVISKGKIDSMLKETEIVKSKDRTDILKKIELFEENGWFDVDVENDPPSKILMPNKVDYLQKKLSSKIARKIAYSAARKFMNKLLKEKQLIISDVKGIEHWKNLDTGAIITCNHFNAMDSFAMQYAYDKTGFKKRKLYKVIREGNYTSFGGFYGYLMRHCNTLPLSSNAETMKKFINAVDVILKKREFILVYPEQSMWWNYKKPKPLKKGAFNFAVRNNVPVVPIFITMQDSDIIAKDGFPIQKYTINIFEPIYPNKTISARENIEAMMQKNYDLWKDCYEKTYGIPLVYNTKKDE